jgi:hypothetical protein
MLFVVVVVVGHLKLVIPFLPVGLCLSTTPTETRPPLYCSSPTSSSPLPCRGPRQERNHSSTPSSADDAVLVIQRPTCHIASFCSTLAVFCRHAQHAQRAYRGSWWWTSYPLLLSGVPGLVLCLCDSGCFGVRCVARSHTV